MFVQLCINNCDQHRKKRLNSSDIVLFLKTLLYTFKVYVSPGIKKFF